MNPIIAFLTSPKFLVAVALTITGSIIGYQVSNMVWTSKYSELEVELITYKNTQLKLENQIKTMEKKAAETTTSIITKYVDKVKVVREQGSVVIREVPVYVTKEADSNCPIPNGWVFIHDKAASGTNQARIPEAPGNPNEASTGVTLSSAAETVALNYQQYHELAEQLTSLQTWVKQQESIYNNTR